MHEGNFLFNERRTDSECLLQIVPTPANKCLPGNLFSMIFIRLVFT